MVVSNGERLFVLLKLFDWIIATDPMTGVHRISTRLKLGEKNPDEKVILNLFQYLPALNSKPRNEFGVTGYTGNFGFTWRKCVTDVKQITTSLPLMLKRWTDGVHVT